MTQLQRRQFLRGAASAAAAIGISQLDLIHQANRYGKVLAQGRPGRKLALVVGINDYTKAPLYGCVNDTLLQRELLIHRFGFNPADILIVADDTTLSTTKPTRANILTAFEEHLIAQAKEDDVVVFHFSGHGAQVADANSSYADGLNSTLVPIDRTEEKADNGQIIVSDITGETLFLLQSQLKTNQFTAVLDSCHSGGGKRGNLTIRAIEGGSNYERSPEEYAYQAEQRRKLGLSEAEVTQLRKEIAKGTVITSASRDQLAADTPFSGFYAGAFTYALTQYLWQSEGDEQVKDIVNSVARRTTRISSTQQVPEFESKVSQRADAKPVYFLKRQAKPAEAVISKAEGDKVELWLGGVDPVALDAFGQGSVFTLLNEAGQPDGKVELTEKHAGLRGFGRLVPTGSRNTDSTLKQGLLLQEETRALPKDLPLKIGLDESLSAAEMQLVKTQLPELGRYEAVAPLGKTDVHYILGRMTGEIQRSVAAKDDVPALNSVGLYSPGLELVPDSFGSAGETIESALKRLKAKLNALLAARLIKLVVNAESSQLGLAAKLKVISGNGGTASAKYFTVRGARGVTQPHSEELSPDPTGEVSIEHGIMQVPLGAEANLEISNLSNDDFYVSVLVIAPDGNVFPLFPVSFDAGITEALIKAGQVRTLPDRAQGDRFRLRFRKPLGVAEVLIVASAAPLREALKAMASEAKTRGHTRGMPLDVQNPLALISKLQSDLNAGTRGCSVICAEVDPEATLKTTDIAAMSITFQVV